MVTGRRSRSRFTTCWRSWSQCQFFRARVIRERFTRALKNWHCDQLRQHVVNLERDLRPVTIGKQIAVQRERDRGRRIERVRIVLLELDRRWRGRLPQSISRQKPPAEPPYQHCPSVQLHLTDSSANGKVALYSSPCWYRARR